MGHHADRQNQRPHLRACSAAATEPGAHSGRLPCAPAAPSLTRAPARCRPPQRNIYLRDFSLGTLWPQVQAVDYRPPDDRAGLGAEDGDIFTFHLTYHARAAGGTAASLCITFDWRASDTADQSKRYEAHLSVVSFVGSVRGRAAAGSPTPSPVADSRAHGAYRRCSARRRQLRLAYRRADPTTAHISLLNSPAVTFNVDCGSGPAQLTPVAVDIVLRLLDVLFVHPNGFTSTLTLYTAPSGAQVRLRFACSLRSRWPHRGSPNRVPYWRFLGGSGAERCIDLGTATHCEFGKRDARCTCKDEQHEADAFDHYSGRRE